MPQPLGQHFLIDPSISQTVIDSLRPRENDTVIEVGPGHGALTVPLAEHLSRLSGTHLIAVERDTVLADEVRATLRTKGLEAQVIHGDIRTALTDITEPLGSYVLTGNLPYYLTGFFFRLLSELPTKPARAVFMVQREVAERMTAEPPHMNLLAAAIQHWTSVSLVATVPVSAFSPRPRVEGALVLLVPLTAPERTPEYYALVRSLFKQPRKTVRNNILSASAPFTLTAGTVDRTLAEVGIDPSGRPHDLSVGTIERLARHLLSRT